MLSRQVFVRRKSSTTKPLLFVGIICLAKILSAQCAAPAQSTTSNESVRLLDPRIPEFIYPASEAIILKHVDSGDTNWIARHGWGLWTALTNPAWPGSNSSVYETWVSPVAGGVMSPEIIAHFAKSAKPAQPFHLLQRPRQFRGLRFPQSANQTAPFTSALVLVTVNWSPELVADVEKNQLQSSAVLNRLLASGESAIHLNERSITLKPTYLLLDPSLLVQGRYYQMSTWPGPPTPATPFPSNMWKQCIWVDARDTTAGIGTGAVDKICASDGSSRTAQTTYGLANFINFILTDQEAKVWTSDSPTGGNVQAGNIVILVAMNVATREMSEWTWQTFWWQPDADNPPAPSSIAIAAARPSQLRGAPRHYAQCFDYQMVNPNQPITGGIGTEPVACYNPYLEAPFFGPAELPDSKPWAYKGTTYLENVGVRSNCMSCHIQATYPQNDTAPKFTGDEYIDWNGPEFSKHLKMDFTWSIVNNVK